MLSTGIGGAKSPARGRCLHPAELGHGSGWTCRGRLRQWQQAGVWDQLHGAVSDRLGQRGLLDRSRACIDSVSEPLSAAVLQPAEDEDHGDDRRDAPRAQTDTAQCPPAGLEVGDAVLDEGASGVHVGVPTPRCSVWHPPTFGAPDRTSNTGSSASMGLVGQRGNAAAGSHTEHRQGVQAGSGKIVSTTRFDRRHPQRPAVRITDHLDETAVAAVLPGAPPVALTTRVVDAIGVHRVPSSSRCSVPRPTALVITSGSSGAWTARTSRASCR